MDKATLWELQDVLDAINGEGAWKSKDNKFTGSLGNVQAIALRLDISRGTVYKYIKRWKAVKTAIHEQRELRKDMVEDKMFKRIMAGSDLLVIFFARTQMKDRGYDQSNRLELDTSDKFETLMKDLRNG